MSSIIKLKKTNSRKDNKPKENSNDLGITFEKLNNELTDASSLTDDGESDEVEINPDKHIQKVAVGTLAGVTAGTGGMIMTETQDESINMLSNKVLDLGIDRVKDGIVSNLVTDPGSMFTSALDINMGNIAEVGAIGLVAGAAYGGYKYFKNRRKGKSEETEFTDPFDAILNDPRLNNSSILQGVKPFTEMWNEPLSGIKYDPVTRAIYDIENDIFWDIESGLSYDLTSIDRIDDINDLSKLLFNPDNGMSLQDYIDNNVPLPGPITYDTITPLESEPRRLGSMSRSSLGRSSRGNSLRRNSFRGNSSMGNSSRGSSFKNRRGSCVSFSEDQQRRQSVSAVDNILDNNRVSQMTDIINKNHRNSFKSLKRKKKELRVAKMRLKKTSNNLKKKKNSSKRWAKFYSWVNTLLSLFIIIGSLTAGVMESLKEDRNGIVIILNFSVAGIKSIYDLLRLNKKGINNMVKYAFIGKIYNDVETSLEIMDDPAQINELINIANDEVRRLEVKQYDVMGSDTPYQERINAEYADEFRDGARYSGGHRNGM